MNTTIHLIEELRKALSAAADVQSVLAAGGAIAVRQAGAEMVYLYIPDSEPVGLSGGEPGHSPMNFSFRQNGLYLGKKQVALPLFISDTGKARIDDDILSELNSLEIKSFALVPIYSAGQLCAVMEFRFVRHFHRWGRDDSLLLQQIAEYSGIHIDRLKGGEDRYTRALMHDSETLVDELVKQYQRLACFGNLIIIRTDKNLVVTDVIGETENILGFTAQELMHDRSVWLRFVHPNDLRRLLLKSSRSENKEINEEIRVVNQRTGITHWLLLRAVPRHSPGKQFLGWEGFGVDITEKHTAQEELVAERRRIEALYAVSNGIQHSSDPSMVMLKALKVLVSATRSDGGLAYLTDAGEGTLDLVAAEGVDEDSLSSLQNSARVSELAKKVIANGKGMLVDDFPAAPDAAAPEGLQSAIAMPLVFEGGTLGVLLTFRRRTLRYSAADFDLVVAAASQVALAVREVELYAAEKRQARSLAALYRLSHTLSRQVSLREVIDHAFPVIRDELSLRRMWLGVVNERKSHIIGQAGYGPGIRQHVIDLQIELGRQHKYLDEALKSRQSVIVERGASFDCEGLSRILESIKPETFIIVPLIAIGQVVGVLVVEPENFSSFMTQERLPLLNSMASEMAPVILARLLEARMADADKMRMAGLLASGVAHNFNNLLQAVIGQASLVEMYTSGEIAQRPDQQQRICESARTIIDAAGKGANLVKQLFSLSAKNTFAPKAVSVSRMLDDSRDIYKSLLGNSIELVYRLDPESGEIMGDYASIQQVLTNIMVNSREAIGERGRGRVSISSQRVRVRSGEVHPELAPGVYLRVDIEDDGPGMAQEDVNRCFEPFFTTKNIDSRTGLGLGGSGLGLSTAYWIMKRHDGIIAARSQPGMGATFSLYFPAVTIKTGEKTHEPAEKAVQPEIDSGDENLEKKTADGVKK